MLATAAACGSAACRRRRLTDPCPAGVACHPSPCGPHRLQHGAAADGGRRRALVEGADCGLAGAPRAGVDQVGPGRVPAAPAAACAATAAGRMWAHALCAPLDASRRPTGVLAAWRFPPPAATLSGPRWRAALSPKSGWRGPRTPSTPARLLFVCELLQCLLRAAPSFAPHLAHHPPPGARPVEVRVRCRRPPHPPPPAVHELLAEGDWDGLRPMMSAKLHAAYKDTAETYQREGFVYRTALSGPLEVRWVLLLLRFATCWFWPRRLAGTRPAAAAAPPAACPHAHNR